MRTNSAEKTKLLILCCIVMLLYFIVIPVDDVCSSDGSTQSDESAQHPFIFENTGKSLPDGLIEQIKLYWQYKGAGKFESAYEIEAPHTKYQVPVKNYLLYHVKARKLKGCRVLNIEKNDNLAMVRVELLFFDDKQEAPARSSAKTQIMNERWIDLNGKWYHVYINSFANIR